MSQPTFPFEPFRRYLNTRYRSIKPVTAVDDETMPLSDVEIAELLGCSRTTIMAARRRDWVSLRQADEWACRTGVNPWAIWGDLFHAGCEDDQLELDLEAVV